MADGNVELVRRSVAAWNRRDVAGFLAFFAPECEVRFRSHVPEPGPYNGPEALRRGIESFLDAWEAFKVDLGEVGEVGNQIVADLHLKVQGRESDLGYEANECHIFEIRDGQILRWRGYSTREEALQAAMARGGSAGA
jgi:ketosteroid isomerase-like protein